MKNDIISFAKSIIQSESISIGNLVNLIDADFEKTVQCIFKSKGRVVISGIGKSAIIARKIVATLNSTGMPSIFMHAADALHGDLGILQKEDIVICISKSGETSEIKVLIPFIKKNQNILIAMTGNPHSFLSKQADYTLNTFVKKETCPNNLAPTNSSTAQLVMGDAIAMTLMSLNKFTETDFAKYHPGGNLGKRLYLRVNDLIDSERKPEVYPKTDIQNILLEMSTHRLGATAVTKDEKLMGIITDGDIRRILTQHPGNFSSLRAIHIMCSTPKVIEIKALATEAINLIKRHDISQLITIDKAQHYKGMIHIHDLIKEGIL